MNFENILIIGFIAFMVFYVIKAIITSLIETISNKRYEKKVEPQVNQLINKVDSLDFSEIKTELDKIKIDFDNRLSSLKLNEDLINKCPSCGDTLTIKNTSYYGKIISCPNYPKCRYKIKISDIDLSLINKLKII